MKFREAGYELTKIKKGGEAVSAKVPTEFIVYCEKCKKATNHIVGPAKQKHLQHHYGCRGIPSCYVRLTCSACSHSRDSDISKD